MQYSKIVMSISLIVDLRVDLRDLREFTDDFKSNTLNFEYPRME